MSSTSALTSDRMLKKVSNFVLSRTSPCGCASEGARLGAPGVGGWNGEAFLSILVAKQFVPKMQSCYLERPPDSSMSKENYGHAARG